ncbi:aromatic ring-hydroxylating oxygenase subunit alpha [Falsiroseomonas selenitidurans]|uniref:Aromatic ring-hydroxylating dioxygenase subunit alpha n=1 Tax=Falsiroseomonas selenitidurans TaxID=2716335 RepID=A0ABX1E5D8_9PROT|nr:aromatic ring-hydroxylating dioxygenase subunit alpha [Falsiroseomonas selenitidurans]NKC32208.1 aromatic ring-hydroxylating dioxygenase subunit alpha [Falsiroseomonas selenitidurans]
MLATQHPVFRRFWYPIFQLEELAAGPRGFRLLGEDIVLWLDEAGAPACLQDRCPHRSAKLSVDSTVVKGALACGYHGWEFARSGTCLFVPQMPELRAGARSAAKPYACVARYGFAWVCLDENPLLPIPDLPHAEDQGFRQIFEYAEDWEANFLRVAENALDVGHVAFVHRATIGDDSKPTMPRLTLVPMPHGVNFRCDLPVANRADQQRNLRIAAPETVRKADIKWLMPGAFTLHFTYPNGLVHAICGFATPIDDQRCRRIQFVYRSDTEAEAPGAAIAAFDRRVGSEDRRLLESCPADFPLDPKAEAHMILDRPSLVMRQMLRRLLRDHDPNAHLAAHELAAPDTLAVEAA